MTGIDCAGRGIRAQSRSGRSETTLAYAMIAATICTVGGVAPRPAVASGADSAPTLQYQWLLDTDPGWATEGEWEFGEPQGLGGEAFGEPDPNSAYTGANVYGVDLYGDYSVEIGGPYCLTVGPLDMSDLSETSVRFWRWLNSDWLPWVSVKVEVSNDNVTWVTLWENEWVEIADEAWNYWEFDIAEVADDEATVWIRWSYQVYTGGTWAYSGWNIDDVEIWGVAPETYVRGDLNCDGSVDYADIDAFVLAIGGQAAYLAQYSACHWRNADCDLDGDVDYADIDSFVAVLGAGG